jgi:hypothetical protein
MDASKPITAAVFSAFLKCPTKAHLLTIGESAPSSYFANIEGRISSMYKAVAKQKLRVGAEVAELLDFGQLWRSLDHEAITHHVDCETAVYDFARSPDRLEDRQPQQSTLSNTFVPVLFLPWNKPDISDNLRLCFGALALLQGVGLVADIGTLIYGDGHHHKTLKVAELVARTRQTIDAIGRQVRGDLPRSGPASPYSEQALRRLRFPAEVSRSRHRMRQFEPAHRDDRQRAGEMQCQRNLHGNTTVVRLSPSAA